MEAGTCCFSTSPLSSRAKPRDLRFSKSLVEMFFDRGSHGPFGPPKGMKTVNRIVIPTGAKRSGGTCCSTPLSRKCFSTGEVMGPRPTQGDEDCFRSATAFNGSLALPFAPATQARRADPPDCAAQPGRAGTQVRNIAERRRCGTARAGSSWKCFSTERSAYRLGQCTISIDARTAARTTIHGRTFPAVSKTTAAAATSRSSAE
jgi:hypothetical protein